MCSGESKKETWRNVLADPEHLVYTGTVLQILKKSLIGPWVEILRKGQDYRYLPLLNKAELWIHILFLRVRIQIQLFFSVRTGIMKSFL